MKIKFIFLFLTVNCLAGFSQIPNYFCDYGFTYEISQQESWGYRKPIVLSVAPLSSAALAGLQPNDIIDRIDGQPTEGEIIETIEDWMYDINLNAIRLTVSNLKTDGKELTVTKKCSYDNRVTEKDLASSYAFYSLEDVQKRSFVCPFRTVIAPDVDLLSYQTFAFVQPDENNRVLENQLNDAIQTALQNKGLSYDANKPDLIIQTYYSYKVNQNRPWRDTKPEFPAACRYSVQSKTMLDLPIYDHFPSASNQAEYYLTLGIQLVDRRASASGNLKVVWECTADELLAGDYPLGQYADFHIPLMMMQFPFAKSLDYAKFLYQSIRYNYTGINYNIEDLGQIISVDDRSPAYKAGIQRGDYVEKINDIPYNGNPEDVGERYRQFIFNTFDLRDSHTFTNAYGFSRCAYWDKLKYPQVSEAFKKQEFQATFSYLFYFEPFVNSTYTNKVAFNIISNKQKFKSNVWPEIRLEESFETVK
ncbi:hypothetical protein FACS189437_04600 [Bacteroidia bacterium]|nr:hypothetical protein FACS189437_04600 [Bacteroidia bacterium]